MTRGQQRFRLWRRGRLRSGAPWSRSQSQSQSECVWWCWRCLWRSLFPSGAPGASGDNSERQTGRNILNKSGKPSGKSLDSCRDSPGRAHRWRSASVEEAFADDVTDVFFLTLCVYASWNISSVSEVELKRIGVRFTLVHAAKFPPLEGANGTHRCVILPWRSPSTAPPGPWSSEQATFQWSPNLTSRMDVG